MHDCLASTNSHASSGLVDDYDEVVHVDPMLLQTPGFRRCGILFQALRNMENYPGTFYADGLLLTLRCEHPDFAKSLACAWLLSKTEVLLKYPIESCNMTRGYYHGIYEQPHKAFVAYVNDPVFPRRQFHLVLLKFPTSHPLENLFSRNPVGAKLDPHFLWCSYEHLDPKVPWVHYVQFAVALTTTKERLNLQAEIPVETPEQRATREANERYAEHAATVAAAAAAAGGRGGGGSGGGGGRGGGGRGFGGTPT
jgi:hypothetical protein